MDLWHQVIRFFTSVLEQLADVYSFLGGHRWAAAIITLTLIVRTLLLPIAVKQIRSMRDTQRLAPEMQRIRQKYRSDRQKMTEEVMALYKREGVNPYASCLPLIAQGPVFFAMFQVIRDLTTVPKALATRLAPQARARDIAVLELARELGHIPAMPFLGLGDLSETAISTPAGWMLLVLMTATQWYSARQLSGGGTDQQQKLMQYMPLFFVVFMVNFPAALVLYWTTTTVYQFVQQNVMLRGWDPRKWFAKPPPPAPRPKARATAPLPEPAPRAAAPVPAATTFGSAVGVGSPVMRRDLSDKRKRRRKKKRKRR